MEIPIQMYPVPSPRQLRAIRSFLGIGQIEFAKRASVSHSTITDYELARREVTKATMQALALCVHTLGIEFRPDGAVVLPE